MKRLFIIDGSAIAYRGFFAFIRNPLRTKSGENTSAVYGFTNSLLKILRDENPEYMAVAFDRPEPTFRHEIYGEYKATREQMPDELIPQIGAIKEMIEAFNIPLLELPGYEADDIMATLAQKAEKEGLEVYLVTGDKDMMQLVSDKIKVYNPKKAGSEIEILGPEEVKEKYGVKPSQIIDFLALMGDASDNVPGVKGIGEKKAVGLLQQFDTLERILDDTGKISSKADREKIEAGRDSALLSKKLVTLDTEVPIEFQISKLEVREWDEAKIRKLFRDLEFNSLLQSLTPSRKSVAAIDDAAYHCVATKQDLEKLCDLLRDASGGFAVDLETTSSDPMMAEIVGYSFSLREKEAFYVPVRCPNMQELEFNADEVHSLLKPVLENESLKKCGQNAKYDMLVLRNAGIRLKGLEFDTMIAAYLINPGWRQYSLDSLADEYFSYTKIPTTDLIGKGKEQRIMNEVPLELITRYACEDADFTLRLRNTLSEKISGLGLTELCSEIEMPLVYVLEEMEFTGISLDVSYLNKMSAELDKDILDLEKEIYEAAGESFNINSPQQLGKILFEKLEIHKMAGKSRVRKTKTGYSTDVAVLEQLAHTHTIIHKILEYRQLTKLKNTYVDALPQLVNPKTHRVHTSYNQTIAATGRLSSSNPNLQNIPIRSQRGREIRKAFLPRKEGWLILAADYSQIELRLAAHFSNDKTLIEAFNNGEDVHRRTASLIFHVDPDDVSQEMRYRAKAINFGIIYGMGRDRLAREVQISREEAREFIDAYFINYPGVNSYIVNQISRARQSGFVTTLFGRRRYLPDLHSENQQKRNAAENVAINTPIQGTAADIIKIAMIKVHDEILKKKLSCRMILQIHDELVFELPAEELEVVNPLVSDIMEHAVELHVPVKVDIGVGNNWYEAH